MIASERIPEPFVPYRLNTHRTMELTQLIIACTTQNIALRDIYAYQNGYLVKFLGFEEYGDAILHDGSYGNAIGEWETIGFPWDCGDVSTHDPLTLARYLGALRKGETPWEDE